MTWARKEREMTDAELEKWKTKIAGMSRVEMASLRRFAPAGHPVFNSTLPLYDIFEKRFKELGGMSPQISKQIGW
jgi:hypothetical protein